MLHRHHVDLSNNTHNVIEIPRTPTQQRKSRYHICCIWCFYTTPDTTAWLPDSTAGQIFLVFYEIYRVGDSAYRQDKLCTEGNNSVRILMWFWRGIFVQILYIGNHWSRAWDKIKICSYPMWFSGLPKMCDKFHPPSARKMVWKIAVVSLKKEIEQQIL
jgi:hypothetical protein